MKLLLGLDPKKQDQKEKLPNPLESGAPQRQAEDGSRLWNPDWSSGPVQTMNNRQFIDMAVNLFEERIKVSIICRSTIL